MTATLEKHDTFFSLDLQELGKDFFLWASWFGNVFINPRDLWQKPEVRT